MAGVDGSRGNVLPNNAFDLMKHIRENEKKGKNSNNSMREQVHANRLLKQELQREMIERKLMEVEDYTFTAEGQSRARAYEDRLHMESEDLLATQIEKAERDLKKLDFREKIRRDAEERQRQEELERQKKLEAAEKRRQAVVERIRKKKEEEEAAIRRAEEARLREIAEKERAIQLAEERIRSDRSQMEMEDELSNLAEQLHKEYLEKLRWKKEEEERLAAWEEEQRKKDELEALKRKERLAEIEAKKKKLAELRKAQLKSSGGTQETAVEKEELRLKDVQQAREEAIKLGKQMRIQNKAKYVTKKLKDEPSPAAAVGAVVTGTSSLESEERTSAGAGAGAAVLVSPPNLITLRKNSQELDQQQQQQQLKVSVRRPSIGGIEVSSVEIDPSLVKMIDEISTETELSQMKKDLMAEKRALRIEIMSQNSNTPPASVAASVPVPPGAPVASPLTAGSQPSPQEAQSQSQPLSLSLSLSPQEQENNEKLMKIQHRVNEISAIEKCIQNKMDEILTKKKDSSSGTESTSLTIAQPTQQQQQATEKNEILGEMAIAAAIATADAPQRRVSLPPEELYSSIERCLQEINEIVMKYGIIDLLTNNSSNNSNAIATTTATTEELSASAPSASSSTDLSTILRRSMMLKMQLTEHLSKIRVEDDLVGYREKINIALQKISQFMDKHQKQPSVSVTTEAGAVAGREEMKQSLTPEVLQRINSFSSSNAPNSPPKTRPPKRIISQESSTAATSTTAAATTRASGSSPQLQSQSQSPLVLPQEGQTLSVDVSEATSAIGKRLLNLVRHEEDKKETNTPSQSSPRRSREQQQHQQSSLPPVSPRTTSELLTPRRRLGIAEMKDEGKPSSRLGSGGVLDDEPYVVSPRTRVSPRLYPLETKPVAMSSQVKEAKESEDKKTKTTSAPSAGAVAITVSEKTTTLQKPRLHPSSYSSSSTPNTTVSSPVLISTHTRKVAGHVAIEITDLEEQQQEEKKQSSSRRNSYSEERPLLKSCDSTASMLSTGVSDNVESESHWWGGSGEGSGEEETGTGTGTGTQRKSKKKTPPSQQKNSSTEVCVKTSAVGGEGAAQEEEEEEDDWWGQAGAMDIDTTETQPEGERDGDGEGWEGQEGEGMAEEEEFDYNSIPGWNECLHTSMATAAHHAAFYGYPQVLEYLSYYFDVFQMDKNGRTPLFYASLRNHLDCVLFLVSLDSQWIEVGDHRGDTCLHAAAISNGEEVLSFLVTIGEINPNIANYKGLTPIHLCKSIQSLTIFANANATLYCVDQEGKMPLHYRCQDGDLEICQFLCQVMPIYYLKWQDEDGNTPLHYACLHGHEEVVEMLCQWMTHWNDFYLVNKKKYSIIHLAKTSQILQKLYEYGLDLWIPDSKLRYPLFINAFHGKVDCVAFLIDIALSHQHYQQQQQHQQQQHQQQSTSTPSPLSLLSAKDFQGDTALHAACLTGNIQCVSLLLYHVTDSYNQQGLLASQLADKAGYPDIGNYVRKIEKQKLIEKKTSHEIYQCLYGELVAVLRFYQTRWIKLYDPMNDEIYYYDRLLNISTWLRPHEFDERREEERTGDQVRAVLRRFYLRYNPEKLWNINEIMEAFKHKHQELFLQLAERYQVDDFSIFNMT